MQPKSDTTSKNTLQNKRGKWTSWRVCYRPEIINQRLCIDLAFIDEMISDRIVFGTNSLKVQEKLIIQDADLTQSKATDTERTHNSWLKQIECKETGKVTLNYKK